MSEVEHNLYLALVAFCQSRHVELSDDGSDSVVIPVKGGNQIEMPILFLESRWEPPKEQPCP
jgi:hypothetical protein